MTCKRAIEATFITNRKTFKEAASQTFLCTQREKKKELVLKLELSLFKFKMF